MYLLSLFQQTDVLGKLVFAVLLGMSILSWVLILFKVWVLWGAPQQVQQGVAVFWQAPDLHEAVARMQKQDRTQWTASLVQAALKPSANGLAAQGSCAAQCTRALREALASVAQQLQFGQIVLATIGSTAPFVGLLGTVWGIYHALLGIGEGGQILINKISDPVGEALIMTVVGLAVAIPAVLAYNFLGRSGACVEAVLDGFARDLREFLVHRYAVQSKGA